MGLLSRTMGLLSRTMSRLPITDYRWRARYRLPM